MKKWIFSALIAFSGFAYAGPTLNDQVQIEVLPSTPIVILGDTRDTVGKTIKGPWFSHRVMVDNQSSQPVTVIGLTYTIESAHSGIVQRSFNPSDFNGPLHCGQKEYDIAFREFGTFLPGDRGSLRLSFYAIPVQCDPGPVIPNFMIGSLPGTDYAYKVTLRLLGWFGTYNNPSDRLDKEIVFYTK